MTTATLRLIGEPTWRIDAATWHVGVHSPRAFTYRVPVNRDRSKLVRDPAAARWSSVRSRARRKSLAFDLSVSFVRTTMASPCHYCGTACGSSELDKKVPTRGYAMSNVVPACRRCNTLKSNVITYEEMVTVVQVLGWRVTL